MILGNPPYNGFAGMAVDEERELSTAYRWTERVRRPEGHGLNDLYVRFFRMAERRIAEKTGQGVVCFISNYSWLDGLSFTGMRERYLDAFDAVRIDCLNGDKFKTGKVAPDGSPDPSIFSTESDPVGIQVGTAITTLVRKADHAPTVEIAYRPFDNRWLYWEPDGGLVDRPRPKYRPHLFEGNLWLSAAQHLRKGAAEPQAWATEHLGSLHLIERGALMFPAWFAESGAGDGNDSSCRANLSGMAQRYLDDLGKNVEDLFHHVLSVLHDPSYREANAGALRMEWPRIPLPGWPDGRVDGAKEELEASADLGRELARLLDPESSVPSVTEGELRPEIAVIGIPSTTDGRNMAGEDFSVTAGWGHSGSGGAVMPGQGRIVERGYTPDECAALGAAQPVLDESTLDIYLNARTFWRNVPAAVWNYKLGGYQVLKKWLSYRERAIVGRPLRLSEIEHFTDTARRIAVILLTAIQVPEAVSAKARNSRKQ